ncbi:ribonuclease 7-like [Lynx pardinus]|uniref:Ribonuclease 7-like n=1 Tax=Lynx pardinus TaxID=191816 RepID=A0A485NJI1_LYNPA|nr:ribonuclease 7-like [Lynx pardinus]
MGYIDKYTKHCKDLNTFLHEASPLVLWPLCLTPAPSSAATCQTPTVACKKGCENCHLSQGPVSLTTCELTSGKYPDCCTERSNWPFLASWPVSLHNRRTAWFQLVSTGHCALQ